MTSNKEKGPHNSEDKEHEPHAHSVLVFPGQGNQYPGMGKELYDIDEETKRLYHRTDEILRNDPLYRWPVSQISFGNFPEILNLTEYTQMATLIKSLSVWQLGVRLGVEEFKNPTLIAGHSFGQYAALVAAGAIDVHGAIQLVRARAEATSLAAHENPGNMIVVNFPEEASDRLAAIIQDYSLYTCVINTPRQIVLGARKDILEQVLADMKQATEQYKGFTAQKLEIQGIFHSPCMTPAVPLFTNALQNIEIHDAKIPLLVNSTATKIQMAEEIKNELITGLTHPVLWLQTIHALEAEGITKVVEVSSRGIYANMNKRVIGGAFATLTIGGIAAGVIWYKHHEQAKKRDYPLKQDGS